jgi:lysophospholipase L1-like esterase
LENFHGLTYRKESAWLARHKEIRDNKENSAPQILWFGDSLTQGLKMYPDLVKQYLPFTVMNAGFSADRTEHLLWRIKDGEGKNLSPAVVLIWIGTNDISQIRPVPSAEQVFCNIRAVCREVEARFPHTKLVLMGLLPRDASSVHPFRRVIKEVKALLKVYAQEHGWHFSDQSGRFVDEAGHLRMDYLPDGLHLNQTGYEVLLQAIQPLMQGLIASRSIAA